MVNKKIQGTAEEAGGKGGAHWYARGFHSVLFKGRPHGVLFTVMLNNYTHVP